MKSGLHRLQTIVPRNGDSFLGEAGTVLSGAQQLTAFTRSGSCWLTTAPTLTSRSASGNAPGRSGYTRCNYSEDLFFNDVPLLHVARRGDVGPGTWHFDYAADRICVGDDPTGKKVEDNWQGITGLDDHRGTGNAGPYTRINLNVHDKRARRGASVCAATRATT